MFFFNLQRRDLQKMSLDSEGLEKLEFKFGKDLDKPSENPDENMCKSTQILIDFEMLQHHEVSLAKLASI